jgi:hypothetical protein
MYWQRAWTFQEWSLASDIDIACEIHLGLSAEVVSNLKAVVWGAGQLLAKYKLRQRAYAAIDQGFPGADIPAHFDRIKRLFPYVDLILTDNEVDEKEERVCLNVFDNGQSRRRTWPPTRTERV